MNLKESTSSLWEGFKAGNNYTKDASGNSPNVHRDSMASSNLPGLNTQSPATHQCSGSGTITVDPAEETAGGFSLVCCHSL